MKTLANCGDREFLTQTVKIKKSVEKWLTATEVMKIRQRKPTYEVADSKATAEEKKAVIERNAQKEREQAYKNLSDMFDAVFEDHPDETLEVIKLCCFIDPEDTSHSPKEYMRAVYEMMSDPDVLDFFSLLMQLARRGTPSASKA